jgi:hypothetical protein
MCYLYFEEIIPKTRKEFNERVNDTQKIMLEVLNEKVPWSFDKICRTVNMRGDILNRRLPELSQKIRKRYLQ